VVDAALPFHLLQLYRLSRRSSWALSREAGSSAGVARSRGPMSLLISPLHGQTPLSPRGGEQLAHSVVVVVVVVEVLSIKKPIIP